MRNPIPAPGYKLISGKRRPPASIGDKVFIQLRTMGWTPPEAYPVATCNFIHTGSGADIIAIKPEFEKQAAKDGRQANGSYE